MKSIIYRAYHDGHFIPAVGMSLGGCFSPYQEWKMPSVLLTGSSGAGWFWHERFSLQGYSHASSLIHATTHLPS